MQLWRSISIWRTGEVSEVRCHRRSMGPGSAARGRPGVLMESIHVLIPSPTAEPQTEPQTTPETRPETVTPIRPSEAIRLGTITAPTPIRGRLFDGHGGACALGAMAIGLGLAQTDGGGAGGVSDDEVMEALGRALPPQLPHPERYAIGPTVAVVASLNDSCGWSRQRIADWLAGWGH